jgi:iron complex transport system substrate-binding protein
MAARCRFLPVLFALIGMSAAQAGSPRRIVSLNLCVDQLLMVLVEPERIASITWLSRNEGDADLMPLARRLSVNHGSAEEVLLARPDLVIAGRFTTSTTRALLRRAGVPLLEVDPAQDWAGIRRVTREIAVAVGETGRAEAMLTDMDARLDALAGARPATPIPVIGWAGGANDVPGTDTLFNTLLESAGGINVGAMADEHGGFDVERVVLRRPRALLRGVSHGEAPALRNEAARHRLLRRLYPQGQLTYSDALFGCGVPRAAAAAQQLQSSLRDLASPSVAR